MYLRKKICAEEIENVELRMTGQHGQCILTT